MGTNNLQYFNKLHFKNFTKLLNSSINLSIKNVNDYQFKNLITLLLDAYKNTDYYNELFDSINLNLKNFNSLNDLQQIPFLDKKTVIDNHKKFINNRYKKKDLLYMTTGGSTGNPLKIFMDNSYKQKSLATTFFYMKLAGLSIFKDKSVRLHGDPINESLINNKSFGYISKNKLIMSSNHITTNNIYNYYLRILDFKPKYIHAYPSAIFLLTQLMIKNNFKNNFSLMAIFTDSEILHSYQKKILENFFDCKVYSTYGHTEGAVLGVSHPNSNSIHIVPQVGICEIIDKDGKNLYSKGQFGQIVVTGFLNKAFPLIRYRTNDFALIGSTPKSKNIFSYIILDKIEGRLQDYIVSKNKELIPAAPMLFDYNFNWSGIEEFQITQSKIGIIRFNIKIDKSVKASKIVSKVNSEFSKIFNNKVLISTSVVKNIKRTKIGKYKYMVQKLNIEKLFYD